MPRLSDPNRCRAHEIEPLVPRQQRSRSRDPATPQNQPIRAAPRRSPRVDEQQTRLHTLEVRKEIFQRYANWKASGSKRAESPIADIMAEFQVSNHYARDLYNRTVERGSVDNNWATGMRGAYFSPYI